MSYPPNTIPVETKPRPELSGIDYAQDKGGWFVYSKNRHVWTPSFVSSGTDPNLGTEGNGRILKGIASLTGRHADCWFNVTAASTGVTAGTGIYELILPTELTIDPEWDDNFAVGQAELNNSGSPREMQIITNASNGSLRFRYMATYAQWQVGSGDDIGNNDFIRGQFTIPLL